jgi:diguanylate cyclase (GGDEF)-like protein
VPVDGPLPIADGVWWVGTRLPDDLFQCHAYLIDNGDQSVLVDPGSALTIGTTLDKVAQVTTVDSIAYLVCHHPDPDIASGLRDLSATLGRDDVRVVTEWRARALLKHYGHRFDYHLVEDHDWSVPLGGGRSLEFQLTPYLHFPGAMVSFDSASRTLFSSDLFGGFVPDSAVLECDDLDYVIENARPFHQHYMPSTELLEAGLARIRHRWPVIERIAPQHGHVIPGHVVDGAFDALSRIECGVFTLADADLDLRHLLRISEAKQQITDVLLTVAEPGALLAALNAILVTAHANAACTLFVDVPDDGWTMWGAGHSRRVRRDPPPDRPAVVLPGVPAAMLVVRTDGGGPVDADLMDMLDGLAPTLRLAVDQYLHDDRLARRVSDLRRAALTDPLTGLGNRRALAARIPRGDYCLVCLDVDRFKSVNDTFGHGAGDRVLVEVAAAIQSAVREDDSVFRVGGEEFLVVLPESSVADAASVAERLRRDVAALDLAGVAPDGRVTISLGVTEVRGGDAEAFDLAVSDADAALYDAKAGGRNRVTVRAPAVG